MAIQGRSSSDLIGQAQSNYGQGWNAGKRATGVKGIAARRRAQNMRRTQMMWRQQKHDERSFSNALTAFNQGADRARATGNQAFVDTSDMLKEYGNYLTSARQEGIDRFDTAFGKARETLQPRADREEERYNYLLNSIQPTAHLTHLVGARGDEGFDARAAKDARSVLNARGSGGVMAQAAIEEARWRSARQRQEDAQAAHQNAQTMGLNLWQDATRAGDRISDLFTAGATAANNLGLQYDAFKGQNVSQQAQNRMGQGMYNSDLDMAKGNAQMQYHNRLQATGRGDANWWRNAGYNIDNWGANAELQDYMMQQQLAAQKESNNNALFGGLLKAGTSLATAGMTGGGSLIGSFFS